MGEMYSGVKFYSASDMSCGYNVEKSVDVINNFNDSLDYNDVNKIIEFYNIMEYFKNKIYLIKWTKEQIDLYINIIKKFPKHIYKFFNKIDESNVKEIISDIDLEYLDDFWKLFDRFKVYDKISRGFFNEILKEDRVMIEDILKYKDIVQHYDKEIRQYLLNDTKSAELILDYFLAVGLRKKKLYFPISLSLVDKEVIIDRYIDWRFMNSNYLKLIYEAKSSNDLCISDKVKLKARKREKEEWADSSKNGVGFEYGVELTFSKNQDEDFIYSMSNGILKVSYSTRWFNENKDFPTLLNNFIYYFAFTDCQFRIQHVHNINKMSALEKVLGIKGKNEYITGVAFNQLQALALVQMHDYYNILNDMNIRLEDIIGWFFSTYLQEEFRVENFTLNLPSSESTYLEKCRSLASEIDSVLKQFKMYVEDGKVDHELLQISSGSMKITDIPSMVEKKYIYLKGDEIHRASYLLFSDQSVLRHVISINTMHKSFFELVNQETIKKDQFQPYQLSEVEWLIENGYVVLGNNNIIKTSRLVLVLKDYYDNNVICNYYSSNYKDEIGQLTSKGLTEYKSTLFSVPEQEYYNYIMNKAEFSNGLDLRNRYVHGTQPLDPKIHEQDYFTFLRILILIIIKINEDFCLKFGM